MIESIFVGIKNFTRRNLGRLGWGPMHLDPKAPGEDAVVGLSQRASRNSMDGAREEVRSLEANFDLPEATENSSSQVLVELSTLRRVLSTLSMQLHDIDTDIHSSVLAVTQGFQGMATRAQEATRLASASLSADNAVGGEQQLSEIQRVLNKMQEEISFSSQATRESSERLSRVEEHLASITKEVASIEQLAQRARVVALNGQIEAARLGSAGDSFMVVVEETKELSIHASQTGKTIRDVVTSLVNEITETSQKLKEQSDLGHQRVEASHQVASELLEAMEVSRNQLTDSIQQTQSVNRDLAGDICKAVMAMQFEDRVSQRISHVIGSLDLLAHRSVGHQTLEDDMQVEANVAALLAEIASQFTMVAEHQALTRTGGSGTDEAQVTSTVELF